MNNFTIIACSSASLAVMLVTYVIYDFFNYISDVQRERFLDQAATELDDVLIMIPPGKVLDVSLAFGAVTAFICMLAFAYVNSSWTWFQMLFVSLVAIPGFFAPRFYLRHLKRKRLQKFNEQLEDALTSMSSSLKAGFSINQAIEAVAAENKRPISVEFRLLVQEMRLGVPLEEALNKMVKRMESQDFELVAAAIITARQTGGALTETLERLAGVIRERMRINLKLQSLTAQGKMQATVIALMPVFLLIAMYYISPEMIIAFFHSVAGILMLVLAVILVIIGFLIIKKITTIDI